VIRGRSTAHIQSRIALVHDYLNQRGGAERVFSHIARAYPQAPIYTSLIDAGLIGDLLDAKRVRSSVLQYLPAHQHYFRFLAPVYPWIFEHFDLRAYDLVVSSTTAWAKGVHVRPDAIHVCYINTVSRFTFAYDRYVQRLLEMPGGRIPHALQALARPMIDRLVAWDRCAAQRPTAFIANSQNVAKRVRAFYGREAYVLPCPVDVDAFSLGTGKGGYALVVARLLPYKSIDIAIDGCARVGVPLIVVGSGPAEAALRARATGTATRFLTQVNDAERARLMADARVVILPGEEDFGLVPIEAAAAGRPTLALRAGGACETIREGETGAFFEHPCAESLAEKLAAFDEEAFSPSALRAYAEGFSPGRFTIRLRALIERIRHERQERDPVS